MGAQPELEWRAVARQVGDGELLAEYLERPGADRFRIAPNGADQPVADLGEHLLVARGDLAEGGNQPGGRAVEADGEREGCRGETVAE